MTRKMKMATAGVCVGVAALAVVFGLYGCRQARKAKSSENSDAYATQLQQILQQPTLDTLRWPNFAEDRQRVEEFYDDREQQLAWTRDGKPTNAATALIALFEAAELKGLNAEDYDSSRWAARTGRLNEIETKKDTGDAANMDIAQFDVAMTVTAARYLQDLHVGRVNPQALNFDIDTPAKRATFDVATLLNDQVVDSSEPGSIADTLEPQNLIYKATEAALPQYIALARTETAKPPPALPSLPVGAKAIDVGGNYSAVAQLIAHLQIEGDLPAGGDPSIAGGTRHTPELAAAVKHFQARHALADDGKLGQTTIDALNVPMSQRVQQMDLALERWRWLPDTYVQPRVMVNLPEFLLRAYTANHTLDFKMRVVDGAAKGDHDTPMFVRLMRYVVFRPYWNLPPSIVKKEIVPHLQRSGMSYLGAHGYEVTKRDGTVVDDVSPEDIEHLRYMVRQKPGPSNSLGLVKFLFPNEYDVYMHSTPELNLFGLARRDKSHGCVRLQHADQMALWVLGGDQKDPLTQTAWDIDGIHDAMSNEDKNNKTINLHTPLPVLITYLTATGDEDGSMHFFNDVYGYDKQLAAALAKGRPYPRGEAKINPTLVAGETE